VVPGSSAVNIVGSVFFGDDFVNRAEGEWMKNSPGVLYTALDAQFQNSGKEAYTKPDSDFQYINEAGREVKSTKLQKIHLEQAKPQKRQPDQAQCNPTSMLAL